MSFLSKVFQKVSIQTLHVSNASQIPISIVYPNPIKTSNQTSTRLFPLILKLCGCDSNSFNGHGKIDEEMKLSSAVSKPPFGFHFKMFGRHVTDWCVSV